jgi:hypothetical protein
MLVSGFMTAKAAEHFLSQRKATAVSIVHMPTFLVRPFRKVIPAVLHDLF